MSNKNTLEFAKQLDAEDPLKDYADKFHFPKIKGEKAIYFTGNSLGLQPKNAKEYVCLLYTSPSPRDRQKSRMPSSA